MNCEYSLTSEDRKNLLKVSQTKQMKQEFEQFVESSNSMSRSLGVFVNEMKESLNVKTQIFVSLEQLARAFEALSHRTSGKHCMNWTECETSYLISIVAHYCNFSGRSYKSLTESDWQILERIFPTKTAIKMQKRWSTILAGSSVPADVKSGKTCNVRLLQKGTESNWSSEEELKLMNAFLAFGSEWPTIANRLGNRTQTDVKNRLKLLVKKIATENKSLSSNLSQNDETFITQLVREYVERVSAKKQVVVEVGNESDATTTTAESVCEEDIPRADSLWYQRAPVFNYVPNGFHYVPNVYSKSMCNHWMLPSFTYPVVSSVPSVVPCGSFFVSTQQPNVQSRDLNATHLFKIASGENAREEFSKEVTKADSKVFFAMVNVQNQQIQLLEKVSEATFPKYC